MHRSIPARSESRGNEEKMGSGGDGRRILASSDLTECNPSFTLRTT